MDILTNSMFLCTTYVCVRPSGEEHGAHEDDREPHGDPGGLRVSPPEVPVPSYSSVPGHTGGQELFAHIAIIETEATTDTQLFNLSTYCTPMCAYNANC